MLREGCWRLCEGASQPTRWDAAGSRSGLSTDQEGAGSVPYFTCPNCGSSVSVPGFSPTAPACENCCARLRQSDEVGGLRNRHERSAARGRRVRLALVPDTDAPASARRALDALRTEVTPGTFESARLVVSELVTNAVKHAAAVHGGHVDVSIWLLPERLRIEVRDSGTGFDPTRRAPAISAGGWGLHLVEELAEDWGVRSDRGTVVWCDLALTELQESERTG